MSSVALLDPHQRGVVGVQSGAQMAEEVLDLVDRDRVADAGIDAAALIERTAAVDADQFALHVKERPAGIARVDRGVDLDAIGVFEQRPCRILVAMHAGNQAEGDGGREVGREQERIAHGQRPVALLDLVAVAQRGEGKLLALRFGEQFDQRHVADLVDADDNRVVEHAVGKTALHDRSGALHDVEIGQRVPVGVDQDAGAAALPAAGIDGDDRRPHLVNDLDPLLFHFADRWVLRQAKGERDRKN